MMARRTYFYLPTWEDRLQRAGSGQTRTRRGGGGDAGGDNRRGQVQQVREAHPVTARAAVPNLRCARLPPRDPATDAAVCPVCEGSFLGVEVAAPAAVAEAID